MIDCCPDLPRQLLYWADQGAKTISRVNFEGRHRRTVVESNGYLDHPFGLAVFEVGRARHTTNNRLRRRAGNEWTNEANGWISPIHEPGQEAWVWFKPAIIGLQGRARNHARSCKTKCFCRKQVLGKPLRVAGVGRFCAT